MQDKKILYRFFLIDIDNKKTISIEQKKPKTFKIMYYSNKDNLREQILISPYKFPEDKCNTSLSLEELSLENCPISLEKFECYDGIPRGIFQEKFNKNEWLDNLKTFFLSKGAKYICFIGIKKKAM